MKKWFPILAAGIMALSIATNADAARRFGGGMSFGRPAPAQMAPAPKGGFQSTPQSRPQAAPQQQKAAPTGAAAPKPASPLRGMLMGAAAALGIAALAHFLGIGSELGTIILMVLVALAAVTLLKMFFSRRRAPRAASATGIQMPRQPEMPRDPEPVRPQASQFQSSGARSGSVLDEFSGNAPAAGASELPVGFDQYAFLEECKKNFGKLQDAWSTGNVLQLSEFCTDEVFTELTHQLKDRHGETLSIRIESLTAELAGFSTEGAEYVAAVRFKGRLDVSGKVSEIEEVDEIWTLVRSVSDSSSGWQLAGIKQVEEA